MKKFKIIIPTILLVIVIGLLTSYFIYGSMLIDITNEQSISNAFATEPKKPIRILKTAKNGDYFGVLYTDPVDELEGNYHFKYITKSRFYRNKYNNIGGYGTLISNTNISYDFLNEFDDENKKVEAFLYTVNSSLFESNKCSVFEYNSDGLEIDYSKITDEKQIIEMMQRLADSYKKIDEFELPEEEMYIISKNYELSQPNNRISFLNGSLAVEDLKKQTMDEADGYIREYREYLRETKQ